MLYSNMKNFISGNGQSVFFSLFVEIIQSDWNEEGREKWNRKYGIILLLLRSKAIIINYTEESFFSLFFLKFKVTCILCMPTLFNCFVDGHCIGYNMNLEINAIYRLNYITKLLLLFAVETILLIIIFWYIRLHSEKETARKYVQFIKHRNQYVTVSISYSNILRM